MVIDLQLSGVFKIQNIFFILDESFGQFQCVFIRYIAMFIGFYFDDTIPDARQCPYIVCEM